MKQLNYQKLSTSGFTNRLLTFTKEYDINLYDDVVDWIIEQKIDCIKSFLDSKPQYPCYSNSVNALLVTKEALRQELMSFYE